MSPSYRIHPPATRNRRRAQHQSRATAIVTTYTPHVPLGAPSPHHPLRSVPLALLPLLPLASGLPYHHAHQLERPAHPLVRECADCAADEEDEGGDDPAGLGAARVVAKVDVGVAARRGGGVARVVVEDDGGGGGGVGGGSDSIVVVMSSDGDIAVATSRPDGRAGVPPGNTAVDEQTGPVRTPARHFENKEKTRKPDAVSRKRHQQPGTVYASGPVPERLLQHFPTLLVQEGLAAALLPPGHGEDAAEGREQGALVLDGFHQTAVLAGQGREWQDGSLHYGAPRNQRTAVAMVTAATMPPAVVAGAAATMRRQHQAHIVQWRREDALCSAGHGPCHRDDPQRRPFILDVFAVAAPLAPLSQQTRLAQRVRLKEREPHERVEHNGRTQEVEQERIALAPDQAHEVPQTERLALAPRETLEDRPRRELHGAEQPDGQPEEKGQ